MDFFKTSVILYILKGWDRIGQLSNISTLKSDNVYNSKTSFQFKIPRKNIKRNQKWKQYCKMPLFCVVVMLL